MHLPGFWVQKRLVMDAISSAVWDLIFNLKKRGKLASFARPFADKISSNKCQKMPTQRANEKEIWDTCLKYFPRKKTSFGHLHKYLCPANLSRTFGKVSGTYLAVQSLGCIRSETWRSACNNQPYPSHQERPVSTEMSKKIRKFREKGGKWHHYWNQEWEFASLEWIWAANGPTLAGMMRQAVTGHHHLSQSDVPAFQISLKVASHRVHLGENVRVPDSSKTNSIALY